MDAVAKILIFIAAVYLGYHLLRWAFPRLMRYWFKSMVRSQFGIDIDGPKQERKRSGSPFSSGKRQKPRRAGKKIPSDVGEYVEFEEFSSSVESEAANGSRFKAEEQVVDVKWKDIK